MRAAPPQRRPKALLAMLAAVVLLTGCGLPLESGVQSPGRVAAEPAEPAPVQDFPPGPQPGDSPAEIVSGFLRAQTNPDDGHALARQFLHPDVRDAWDDNNPVVVYSARPRVVPDRVDESVVSVELVAQARIDDGVHRLSQGSTLSEVYRVRRDESGEFRLVEVPTGLRLPPVEAERSFDAYPVYFVGPAIDGTGAGPLVADRVFVPVEAPTADALVRRLLAGPSEALRGAVTSAFPAGTTLRRPVTTVDGIVEVDLTAHVEQTTQEQRRQLSAQLLWTLRAAGEVFTALRLRVDGRPLRVDGVGFPQERDDWPAFDPAGRTATSMPMLYVDDRRLRALQGRVPAGVRNVGVAVDSAVASPRNDALAVRTDGEDVDEVRIGPVDGPLEVALSRPAVTSLSWGSGEQGLWAVTRAAGGEPEVELVLRGAADTVIPVPYEQPTGAGPLSVLRVSRDGARVAAVFGDDADRRLYVGRVERDAGRDASGAQGLRLTGLHPVSPGLTDVADVAWESGTSLVALGRLDTTARLPVRVAVDGSELEPVPTFGLDGEPASLTVTDGQPLVVAAVLDGAPVLFVQSGDLFQKQADGADPAYPG
jgi:hypothetical protein